MAEQKNDSKIRSVFENMPSDEEMGVLARFKGGPGSPSLVSIELCPQAIAEIERLDHYQKLAQTRARDFLVG